MTATIRHEGGNTYRVDVKAILRKSELEQAQNSIAQAIAQHGGVRLLFVLDEFKGWEKGANWGDVDFYETHGDRIERIAIVGDEAWRSDALTFMLADLRKSPIRYFLPRELDGARVWLAQTQPA